MNVSGSLNRICEAFFISVRGRANYFKRSNDCVSSTKRSHFGSRSAAADGAGPGRSRHFAARFAARGYPRAAAGRPKARRSAADGGNLRGPGRRAERRLAPSAGPATPARRRRQTALAVAAVEEEDIESAFDLEAEYQKRIAWVNGVPLFAGLEAEAAAASLPPGAVGAFMDDLARRFSEDTLRRGTTVITKGAVRHSFPSSTRCAFC